MTLIGPECGHLLFCTLSACAALAQVLETRTEFGARVSAPLLAMGTGLLLSGCRIVPPTAPAYDLVCLFKCPLLPKLKVPSPVKNDQLYFLWVTFTR
jgi:hypothetical protein